MLHIYSGNGKGKTTAGFGLVLRQAGYERRVAVAQFLKDGTSGELRALQALSCVKVRATRMPHGLFSNAGAGAAGNQTGDTGAVRMGKGQGKGMHMHLS